MDSTLFGFFYFILGCCIGSFLNVASDRLPFGKSLNGRSHCDYCKKEIAWYDLFPVISYFIIGGKCRYCHKKLSFQYPLVEFVTGVLFLFLFITKFYIWQNYFYLYLVIFTAGLGILISDLKYTIIPDEYTLVLFISGLILNLHSLANLLPGIILSTATFYLLYRLSKGRALGYGDVKLVFACATILSLSSLFLGLYIGFLTGGIVSAILLLTRKKGLKSQVALGPFLIFGLLSSVWMGI